MKPSKKILKTFKKTIQPLLLVFRSPFTLVSKT